MDTQEKMVIELTAEEVAEIQQKRQKNERLKNQEVYKSLVEETVPKVFDYLAQLSDCIKEVKKRVFDDFETILEIKNEVFNVRENQKSHTFSTKDGSFSITIGYRTIVRYDDTVTAGIDKIRDFIKSLAKNDESASLIEIINNLLQQTGDGNLEPRRIIELQKLETRINNPLFSEGLQIIRDAYSPVKSCSFVSASYKDANGKERYLTLSMSAADLNPSH